MFNVKFSILAPYSSQFICISAASFEQITTNYTDISINYWFSPNKRLLPLLFVTSNTTAEPLSFESLRTSCKN